MLAINGKWSMMAFKWWICCSESEKAETKLKLLLNELHVDERSFAGVHSPFREANKWLSSEER